MSQPIRPPLSVEDPSAERRTSNNPFTTLPPGWTTEADPTDGRLFYWHAASGASSWTHPHASQFTSSSHESSSSFQYTTAPTRQPVVPKSPPPSAVTGEENPYMASRRPDNHQCGAVAALFLCPPLGLLALYHSIRVDQCWKSGQYSDAVIHARQSPQFSSWGIMLGAVFWICWFFFRQGRGEWEWPDWKLGD